MRPQWKLVKGGASQLGSSYVSTAVTGAITASVACSRNSQSPTCTGLYPLYIPLVGTFIQVASVTGSPGQVAARRAFLIIDGASQLSGLALLIVGLTVKKPVPIYTERLQLLPYAGQTGVGLVATGSF
jgi:hypothetical protein